MHVSIDRPDGQPVQQNRKFPNRKTVEVLEIEVQELTSSLESIEADMKERVSALTAKYNEMRDKDRKIIAVQTTRLSCIIHESLLPAVM